MCKVNNRIYPDTNGCNRITGLQCVYVVDDGGGGNGYDDVVVVVVVFVVFVCFCAMSTQECTNQKTGLR